VAFFINLMLTSWAIGIFVSGLLCATHGRENLAWSIMFLFMPLTCVYYPVTTLPFWLQPVAWLLPPTMCLKECAPPDPRRVPARSDARRAWAQRRAVRLRPVCLPQAVAERRRQGSLMQTVNSRSRSGAGRAVGNSLRFRDDRMGAMCAANSGGRSGAYVRNNEKIAFTIRI